MVGEKNKMDTFAGFFEQFEETILGGWSHAVGMGDENDEGGGLFGADDGSDLADIFDGDGVFVSWCDVDGRGERREIGASGKFENRKVGVPDERSELVKIGREHVGTEPVMLM